MKGNVSLPVILVVVTYLYYTEVKQRRLVCMVVLRLQKHKIVVLVNTKSVYVIL